MMAKDGEFGARYCDTYATGITNPQEKVSVAFRKTIQAKHEDELERKCKHCGWVNDSLDPGHDKICRHCGRVR